MSILERMRQSTDSTGTRLLVGVIAAAFIFWNVGNSREQQGSVVATVNGEIVTRAELRELTRRAGRDLTDEQVAGLVEQLIQKKVLLQEAERLGLDVSADEIVARLKLALPELVVEGKLDKKKYLEWLAARNMTRDAIEASVREDLLSERIYGFVDAAVDLPEAEIRKAWEAQATTFDLAYVRVSPAAFLAGIEVKRKDRDAWIAANGDALKKRYDELFERFYNLPKRYTLSTILLRTDIPGANEDDVKAKLAGIKKLADEGKDFAELARTWSEDLTASNGGDLGQQAQAQIDAEIVKVADAAGEGKVSDIVKTPRGFQIVLVRDITDAEVIPFEDARGELAVSMIKDERAPAAVADFVTKLREGWTAGAMPPDELLAPLGLTVETTGPWPLAAGEAGEIPRLGKVPGLLDAAKSAKAGDVLAGTWDVRGTTAVVALTARTDADDAQWQQQKELVRAMLLRQARAAHREQWLDALVAQATIERPGQKKAEPAAPSAPAAPAAPAEAPAN